MSMNEPTFFGNENKIGSSQKVEIYEKYRKDHLNHPKCDSRDEEDLKNSEFVDKIYHDILKSLNLNVTMKNVLKDLENSILADKAINIARDLVNLSNNMKNNELNEKYEQNREEPLSKFMKTLIERLATSKYYIHRLAIPYLLFTEVFVHDANAWHTQQIKNIFLKLFEDPIQMVVRKSCELMCTFLLEHKEQILFTKKDSYSNSSKSLHDYGQVINFIADKFLDDDIFERLHILKDKNDYLQAAVGELLCIAHIYMEKNRLFEISEEKCIEIEDLLDLFLSSTSYRIKLTIINKMEHMPRFYQQISSHFISQVEKNSNAPENDTSKEESKINVLMATALVKNLNDEHLLYFLRERKEIRLEVVKEIGKRLDTSFGLLRNQDVQKNLEYQKVENVLVQKEEAIKNDVCEKQEKEFCDKIANFSIDFIKSNLLHILEEDPFIEVKFELCKILKNPTLIAHFCGCKDWRRRKLSLQMLLDFFETTVSASDSSKENRSNVFPFYNPSALAISQNSSMATRKQFLDIFLNFLEDPVAEIRTFASNNFKIEHLDRFEQAYLFKAVASLIVKIDNNYRIRIAIIPLIVRCYLHTIDRKVVSSDANTSSDSIKTDDSFGMSNFSLSQPVTSIRESFDSKNDENSDDSLNDNLSFLESLLEKFKNDPVVNVREKLEKTLETFKEVV